MVLDAFDIVRLENKHRVVYRICGVVCITWDFCNEEDAIDLYNILNTPKYERTISVTRNLLDQVAAGQLKIFEEKESQLKELLEHAGISCRR